MNCSLWLNRKKINSASQISDNLDVASLRGYFLAGSLIEWLSEHDGAAYADKLSSLSADDPALNDKIAEIFSGTPLPAKRLDGCFPAARDNRADCDNVGKSNCMGGSFGDLGSFGGLHEAYQSSGPLILGSAAGVLGSFEFGSFSPLLGSYLVGGGSFSGEFGSFLHYLFYRLGGYGSAASGVGYWSFGSFSEWGWEWLWAFFRGYSGGSFISISTSFGSFGNIWGNIGSFGLFRMFGVLGSFSLGSFTENGSFKDIIPFEMDEYDFIMLKTLALCPLDRFGYGIHII